MSSTYAAGWPRNKPVRPYRNLSDFVSKYQYLSKREWPCLACRGRGWDYDPEDPEDPEDPPCPVKGNRGRNTIPCAACGGTGEGTGEGSRPAPAGFYCAACGGTGEGTKAACVKAYREAIQRFKAEADDYKRLAQVRKELREGLSKEQIRAIKELGI
jgi:hypothetical protein